MSALDQSIQNESRHAIFVNRVAGGFANEFSLFIDQLQKEVSSKLALAGTITSQ